MRTRIEAIRKEIHADAERRDALTGQLKQADLQIQSARERLADVRSRRIDSEQKLAGLKTEQAQIQREVADERDELASELKVAYMNGRQEQLKLLLNQRDPAAVGRMMAYYGYFGRARAERITSITEHLAHLELLGERIATETARLREIEDENAKDVKALAGARERRAQTLAEVQAKLRTRNDQLGKLQSDAQALEKLVEQLRRAIEEFPELAEQPFQRVKGKLPWPVKGALLAKYGQLRAGGPLKWQGLVIAADRGTQVRAPFYGRVVYADWLPGLGLLLVLDHGDGYMSLYGHNQSLLKEPGDSVSPGETIAQVGDTGGQARPALYFEIRAKGEPVNPHDWIKKPVGR